MLVRLPTAAATTVPASGFGGKSFFFKSHRTPAVLMMDDIERISPSISCFTGDLGLVCVVDRYAIIMPLHSEL